ncbi:MAG TPA: hypothetical protein VFY93_07030 [Planctomycetota bacterium]|nr:hypothetical protein [Planctomycetota bacterium]
MIPLLRVLSFVANAALFAAPPLLLGFGWLAAAAAAAALFVVSWWACGRAPPGAPAHADVLEAAARAAERMGVRAPRFVRTVPGWIAGAVRARGGYGLVLGEEVAARHREALLAHEIAHYVAGDLLWEPFTDGPARVLLETTRGYFRVLAVPFALVAAPLGKVTELNADRLAAGAFPSYAATLHEVADRMGPGAGLFYPSLAQRARHAARYSKGDPPSP